MGNLDVTFTLQIFQISHFFSLSKLQHQSMADEKDTVPCTKRGKNWTEADSVKLLNVYQQVQFEKLGKTPLDF